MSAVLEGPVMIVMFGAQRGGGDFFEEIDQIGDDVGRLDGGDVDWGDQG